MSLHRTVLHIHCKNFLGEAVTKFFHDKIGVQEIERCTTKNCYNLRLQYNNSMTQMQSIIRKSMSCTQELKVLKLLNNQLIGVILNLK